jgi:hypothetical protein
MLFNFLIWIVENPARADKSAVGARHRPLHCHPEHIRSAQCKLREGSGAMGTEMLSLMINASHF